MLFKYRQTNHLMGSTGVSEIHVSADWMSTTVTHDTLKIQRKTLHNRHVIHLMTSAVSNISETASQCWRVVLRSDYVEPAPSYNQRRTSLPESPETITDRLSLLKLVAILINKQYLHFHLGTRQLVGLSILRM